MRSAKTPVDTKGAAFTSSLASHFKEKAGLAGLNIDNKRIVAVWEQGLFIAGVGAKPKAVKGGALQVGVIHIQTPGDRPLRTKEKAKLPSGSYMIQCGGDGSVALKRAGGRIIIPASPAGTARIAGGGGGPRPICDGDYLRFSFQYRKCEICISVECPGRWIVLLTCFELPFCNPTTGSIDWPF